MRQRAHHNEYHNTSMSHCTDSCMEALNILNDDEQKKRNV